MDTEDLQLPHGVALAWGVVVEPHRGPRREMSVEAIVEAAIALADAEGLGAVSMAKVASALGFTTMSLYRYVSAKDDLVLLMAETAMGPAPLTPPPGPGWRAGLETWLSAIGRAYASHDWLLDIPIDAAPATPNQLSWLDWGLVLLEGTALDDGERLAAIMLVSAHARWRSTVERNLARSQEAEGGARASEAAYARVLRELVSADRFPALAPAIARGMVDPSEGTDLFAFGAQRILDGLEAYVARLPGPQGRGADGAGAPGRRIGPGGSARAVEDEAGTGEAAIEDPGVRDDAGGRVESRGVQDATDGAEPNSARQVQVLPDGTRVSPPLRGVEYEQRAADAAAEALRETKVRVKAAERALAAELAAAEARAAEAKGRAKAAAKVARRAGR